MQLAGYYIIALAILLPVQMTMYHVSKWIMKGFDRSLNNLNLKQLKRLSICNFIFLALLAIPHRSSILAVFSLVIGLTLFIINTNFNFKQFFIGRSTSKTAFGLQLINLCIHPAFIVAWLFSSLTGGIWDDLGWAGY